MASLGFGKSNNKSLKELLSIFKNPTMGNTEMAEVLANLDLQLSNQFQILILPYVDLSSISGGSPSGLGLSALSKGLNTWIDNAVWRFFVQDITVPSDYTFEYERLNSQNHVVNIAFQDKISVTFMEDDFGLVQRYMTFWGRQIAYPAKLDIATEFRNENPPSGENAENTKDLNSTSRKVNTTSIQGNIVFRANQRAAKKKMLLYLTGKEGRPFYPGITIHGLRPVSKDPWELSQSDGDALNTTWEFTCDYVKIDLFPFEDLIDRGIG